MILADKIIRLRKKNGWSQEELAEKMDVSRQAVSKWEGAQTIPDLDKILKLSQLFGVTTDYLLKDEMEDEEFTGNDTDPTLKRVSLADANEYLAWREKASIIIASATYLCILSPIILIVMSGIMELPGHSIDERKWAVAGLIIMFILAAIAVSMYIFCGFKNSPYEFLEKDIFETEYGVTGMVKERKEAYRSVYAGTTIIAVALCIISPVPLLISIFKDDEALAVFMIAVMMIVAGIGVFLFIMSGVRWASMQKLLKEGDYTDEKKLMSKRLHTFSKVYWLSTLALFLIGSFMMGWQNSWVIWPIAGIAFAIFKAVLGILDKDKE